MAICLEMKVNCDAYFIWFRNHIYDALIINLYQASGLLVSDEGGKGLYYLFIHHQTLVCLLSSPFLVIIQLFYISEHLIMWEPIDANLSEKIYLKKEKASQSIYLSFNFYSYKYFLNNYWYFWHLRSTSKHYKDMAIL